MTPAPRESFAARLRRPHQPTPAGDFMHLLPHYAMAAVPRQPSEGDHYLNGDICSLMEVLIRAPHPLTEPEIRSAWGLPTDLDHAIDALAELPVSLVEVDALDRISISEFGRVWFLGYGAGWLCSQFRHLAACRCWATPRDQAGTGSRSDGGL